MRVTVTVRASGVREEAADARLSIRYVRWVMIARSGMRVACGRVGRRGVRSASSDIGGAFSKGRAVITALHLVRNCTNLTEHRDPIQSIFVCSFAKLPLRWSPKSQPHFFCSVPPS